MRQGAIATRAGAVGETSPFIRRAPARRAGGEWGLAQEYFPSGELWQDETDSRYELARRYTFTGKELDISTGLYHFGARYYDARMVIWMSPDPIVSAYMRGWPSYGFYQPRNLGLYSYSWNSPVTLKDPDGRFVPILVGIGVAMAFDVGMQYFEAKANNKAFSEVYDWKRTAISGAFGALGGGGAMLAARTAAGMTTSAGGQLAWQVHLSGAYASGISMAQTATMQRYRGEELDRTAIARAGFVGFAAGSVGAALGAGASYLSSRISYGSREAFLLTTSIASANRGSLGGQLSRVSQAAGEAAKRSSAATEAAASAAGEEIYRGASGLLRSGYGTGGGRTQGTASAEAEAEQGTPGARGSGGRYNPELLKYFPKESGGE